MTKPPLLFALAMSLVLLPLSGCRLGPDYVRPDVAPSALMQPRLARAEAAEVVSASPPQRWWLALADPELTWLVEQSLAGSPDLRAAQSRLDAARALLRQRRAERRPSLSASAGYVHAELPDSIRDNVRATGSSIAELAAASGGDAAAAQLRQQVQGLDQDSAELYLAAFDASWELDLFGRRRRAEEQARAEADADAAQLADAQVRLAAEVGKVYANYRGTQQRLAIAEDSRAKAAQMLELTRQRRQRGAATQIEVERVLTQLRQQEAAIPDLRATLQESLDQLALLSGRVPGALDQRLATFAALPLPPARVAVDDAAALIRRRPDVRQAERELAASSARIGQALSAYFPQVTLLGTIGVGADSPRGLDAGSAATLVAPMLRWSLFDFGRARAQVARACAGNAAQAAAYESKVLAALQDANGALARFGASRRTAGIAGEAAAAATRSAELVQQRQHAGASSLIDALDVQRQQLSARDSQIQAGIKLLVDYVGLQKSLGLGWQAPEVRQ